jgi:predicted DNA-binding protein
MIFLENLSIYNCNTVTHMKTKHLSIRISEELFTKLKNIAILETIKHNKITSVSDVVRKTIEENINENDHIKNM